MGSKTMRKYLRKPLPQKSESVQWSRIYRIAVERAEDSKDPRLSDLLHYGADPEKALRRLSIISELDLEREFPR